MHRPTVSRIVLAIVLGVAAAPSVRAQADSAPPPGLCWRGRPLPHCKAFWITEFGFDFMNSTTRARYTEQFPSGEAYTYVENDFSSRLVWTVGPMVNIRPLRAAGLTLSISPLNQGSRASLEGRYRLWVPEGSALDFSAGVVRADIPVRDVVSPTTEHGVTAAVFLVGGDVININARGDLLFTGGKRRAGTSVGI